MEDGYGPVVKWALSDGIKCGIGKGQTGYSHPIPKAGIGGSPRFATTWHWQRANRVQPSNSKGGNWWQSPFCDDVALAKGKPGTAIQFQRRELVAVPALRRCGIGKGQTGYSHPIPKAGIGGSPRFATTWHWQRANRVQPSNSKGGNWWQSPLATTWHWQRANRVQPPIPKAGIGGSPRFATTWHWQRANRVQPSNSKGGNWWQSPLCDDVALAKGKPGTAIQFQRRELVAVPALRRCGIGKGQTGYSHPIPKAGIGGSPRFATMWHWQRANRVQPPIPKAGIGGSPRFATMWHWQGQTGYSHPIPKAGIGGSPRFATMWHWQRANRVQPSNSKGGNWWQSPFCDDGALAKGKPGTAIQFQRRELVAVPVLRRQQLLTIRLCD